MEDKETHSSKINHLILSSIQYKVISIPVYTFLSNDLMLVVFG
jgi:hypothetical protein